MTVTPESFCNGSESGEQRALFCWTAHYAAQAFACYDAGASPGGYYNLQLAQALRMLFAVPNGDQRGDGTSKGAQIAGARLKAEGLRDGVPDIFLAHSVCAVRKYPFHETPQIICQVNWHGLFIEMKRPSLKSERNPNAGCKPEQLDWHMRLREQGYCVIVCYSWIEAREAILSYVCT